MNTLKMTASVMAAAAVFICAAAFPAYAEGRSDAHIDYSDKDNWAFWDYGEDKEADLFIICPTVDMGKDGNYNSDITNEKIKSKFVGALNMELGIYTDVASVYSPYYRQATFPVYSLSGPEQKRYLETAYDDVYDAFVYYADNCDESRPLILAGFSQGSDMLIRLMSELFNDEKYSDRLVAAYAIGWSLSEEQTDKYTWLKPAQGEEDTGVIVMFNSEAEHVSSSLMVGEDEHTYSINPLNWKTDGTPADKSLNQGACFTDYDGNITSEIPELTGAYIDEKRGTLKVPDISEADYPAAIFDEGIFHIYDYQFFYRNLQENVAKRTAAYTADKAVVTSDDHSLKLEAVIDVDECYVGDEFVVTVTVENNGNSDLTDAAVYFEDTEVYAADKLEAGKNITFQMKLKAWEQDIESGGVIHISADADELPEPVKAVCSVTVRPAETESNPSTGTDLAVILPLGMVSLLAACAAVKRKVIE